MKSTIISIIVALGLIGGAMFLSSNNSGPTNSVPANNVSVVNGQQIVTINAKGGYQPQKSVAKAGLPTTLRFVTSGSFDCSSSIRIPSLGISKILPQTGNTDIDLGTQQVGVLQGTCGMGMYRFEVSFVN
jgi:plastocyanin domain-containing protein